MPKRSLRILRNYHDPWLRQTDVAERAGMSQSRYSGIENGDEPSKAEQQAIAAALGCKVSDIAWPEPLKVRAS